MTWRTGLLDGRHLRAVVVPTHRCRCGTNPEVGMVEITTLQERVSGLRRYLWGRAYREPGCTCTQSPEALMGEDFLTRGTLEWDVTW